MILSTLFLLQLMMRRGVRPPNTTTYHTEAL